MVHRQDKGGGPAYLSRTWLLVWFVLQWLVLPVAVALVVLWYVCAFLANAFVDSTPRIDYLGYIYVGPRRLAREWSRDPARWEEHFRALLPKLRAEAAKVSSPGRAGYPLRARIKYSITHARAEHEERSDFFADVAFIVFAHHYRGCGPEAARRIARADGWRILAPGGQMAKNMVPDDDQGLGLAIPNPRHNSTPPSGRP
ncbi:hypothetical protein ACFYWU_20650 [Streptomyces chrestomyceticus]|uniref:hypothetical protein n=1 Tax=Streptomyces chrestomyceticus TaxID=68185 RepID=UPI0036907333